MKTALDRLTRYVVSCVRAFEADAPDILKDYDETSHPGSYAHENYLYAAL